MKYITSHRTANKFVNKKGVTKLRASSNIRRSPVTTQDPPMYRLVFNICPVPRGVLRLRVKKCKMNISLLTE